MKKLAVICNYILRPDRIGGMDRFYYLYNQCMLEKGVEIDWYFTDYVPFKFYTDFKIYSADNKSVEQMFLNICKTENKKYDVIVTHFTELCTSFYKEYSQLLPDVKIIAVDHNPRPIEGFSLKKRIKKRLLGYLYSKYISQFVGVSKYTVNQILKDYGAFLKHKTQVIYNGIDIEVFEKRENLNTNKFIVASHLRVSKGIQDLILALSYLDKNLLDNVRIDVYGEGPYKSNLIALSKEYKLENVICFKGSSPRLNHLFKNYQYMIQPTYMECFSLSILESLSANVPVITTNVGGNLEVVSDGENGFIYQAGDCDKLASILEHIISGQINIVKDTSLLIAQEFYLEKMVNQHIKILPCT
ncbi:glycosyltransferase family 4 protein [Olleya namhaensis]|uniref:glycosyltransferase family 4 protein n=1 Tax=Olleya namhaensis TaxID=1144750 RepID=UPI00232E737C|nr:glycosyltransferase family 4 protein [Olleya namhaensis]